MLVDATLALLPGNHLFQVVIFASYKAEERFVVLRCVSSDLTEVGKVCSVRVGLEITAHAWKLTSCLVRRTQGQRWPRRV